MYCDKCGADCDRCLVVDKKNALQARAKELDAQRHQDALDGQAAMEERDQRIEELEEQQKDLIEASKQKNTPCGDALDKLWTEILIARDPKYGDWEYPGQAYRHIKAEYEELQARVKSLEADKARLDWLDSANEEMNLRTGTHYGWRFDWNGNRVAILSDMHLPPLSVREALDNAMGAARTAATRKDGAGLRERVNELIRERDYANMVADSAVEKIKELEDALRAADGYENGIIREFEEDRVKELEAHLRKIHDRAHSWNNIPACSDIAEHHARPERT